ncbi:hypothetical protein D9M69_460410 [compost metagenome]
MTERVRDHLRLLIDLLLHEMPVVALVDHIGGGRRDLLRAINGIAGEIEDMHAVCADHRPVAIDQIGDLVGEGRKCDRVGAEEHLALAVADRQRRSVARRHDRRRVVLKEHGERIGAGDPLQHRMHRLAPAKALAAEPGEQMCHDLGVGVRLELGAVGNQFVLQIREVLDDAVVDDGDTVGEVRMGVALCRRAVGCPTRVRNADRAGERLFAKPDLEIDEFALGTPALQRSTIDGRNAGGIIAAVFEALQRIDQALRYRLVANDANNTAHSRLRFVPAPVVAPQPMRADVPPVALPW